MITPKIAANQSFGQLNRLHKHDEQQRHHAAGQGRSETQDVDAVNTQISAFSTHPIQQFNAEFNAVVKSIRIADQAMAEISANIEQMESEVQMFVKNYPPFPPGSEERLQLLSQFTALRKQIDQLTFPPDPFAQQIIGDREKAKSAEEGEINVGDQNIAQAIRRQPVHPGPEGLNLPDLSADAADKDLSGLLGALGEARKITTERRGKLADDAFQVIKHAEKR